VIHFTSTLSPKMKNTGAFQALQDSGSGPSGILLDFLHITFLCNNKARPNNISNLKNGHFLRHVFFVFNSSYCMIGLSISTREKTFQIREIETSSKINSVLPPTANITHFYVHTFSRYLQVIYHHRQQHMKCASILSHKFFYTSLSMHILL
jgi:hypothetical protein